MQQNTKNSLTKKEVEFGLRVLEQYAQHHGFSVGYSTNKHSNSWISFKTKRIVIHDGSTKESRMYDLIHELGHMYHQLDTDKYQGKFLNHMTEFSKSSQVYRMKILEEEIDAWNVGLRLAKRLGVKVNSRSFERRKASKVATYAAWVVANKQVKSPKLSDLDKHEQPIPTDN